MNEIDMERKLLIESFQTSDRRSFEDQIRQWEEQIKNGCEVPDLFSEVSQYSVDPVENGHIFNFLSIFGQALKQGKLSDGAMPLIRQDPLQPVWMENSAVDLLEDGIQYIIHGISVAPFIFLVQSMGYGKTKAVWDLAKEKRRVVYFPCKNLPTYSGDNGYWKVPDSLRKTIDYLQDRSEEECECKWKGFLTSVMKLAGSYESLEDLYNSQITQDGKLGDFYKHLTYDPQQSPMEKSPLLPKPVDEEEKSKRRKTENVSARGHVRLCYEKPTKVDQSSLVVCFDEAAALANHSFRALRLAAKHVGIIVIFSDTTVSISELASANQAAGSRVGGDIGNLSLPIYRLPNFDLEWKPNSDVNDLVNLFKAGRPRWSSLLSVSNDGTASDSDLRTLVAEVTKLLTRDVTLNKDDIDELQSDDEPVSTAKLSKLLPSMIVVFTCRFGLGYTSKIGPLLAKYNLATIAFISNNRKTVATHFPSEPVLAEASASYTAHEDHMEQVLEHIHEAIQSGLLTPPREDLGEMSAAALMGFIMDDLRLTHHDHQEAGEDSFFFSRSVVDLYSFLEQFGCSDSQMVIDALAGWKVNFTHFVRPSRSLDYRDLEAMWVRRKAYYVPQGMKGLDLLIAIYHESKGYATLRVRVKNRRTFTSADRNIALAKLAPTTCPPFVPHEKLSVCLLLCSSSIEETCTLWDYNTTRQIHPQNRTSPLENDGQTSEIPDRLCLRLTSPFVSDARKEDRVARKLLEICTTEKDLPEYWNVDDTPADWDKLLKDEARVKNSASTMNDQLS